MKFGKYLRDQAFSEWRFYYIDYDGLKRLLKQRQEGEAISEAEEATFVDALEKEMQKVRGSLMACYTCRINWLGI